jgi:transposase-like protein
MRRFTTITTAVTQLFLQELREEHDVEDAVFLVDHARHLGLHCIELGSDADRSTGKSERSRTCLKRNKPSYLLV